MDQGGRGGGRAPAHCGPPSPAPVTWVLRQLLCQREPHPNQVPTRCHVPFPSQNVAFTWTGQMGKASPCKAIRGLGAPGVNEGAGGAAGRSFRQEGGGPAATSSRSLGGATHSNCFPLQPLRRAGPVQGRRSLQR